MGKGLVMCVSEAGDVQFPFHYTVNEAETSIWGRNVRVKRMGAA